MTSISIDIKDGLSSSVAIKGPCKVATTANITLVGEQTIDGVAVVTEDRVLVKDQTTASDNGIWIADTGNWRRAKDFNKTKDVKTGTLVYVIGGTIGSGIWGITSADPISVGSTSIAFAKTMLTLADILDEDNMASNSATKVPSQQSTKAYVDQRATFATRAAANGATIDASVTFARTGGYATIGDGGDAEFSVGVSLLTGGFTAADGRFFNPIKHPRMNAAVFGILPADTNAASRVNAVFAEGPVILELEEADYYVTEGIAQKSNCGLVGLGAGQYPRATDATSADFNALPRTRLIAQAGFPADTPVLGASVTRGDTYAIHGLLAEGMMVDCANVADVGTRWRGMKNSKVRDILVYRPTTARTSRGAVLDTAQGSATGQTAAAGGASTITFAAGLAVPRDDWFNGAVITTTGGTGSGQTRTVSAYNGTTKVATVSVAWTTPPDATTVFSITGELLDGTADSNFNIFEDVTIWLGSTGSATGWIFNGDGIADTNQNTYINCSIVHADGPGIRAYNGDTERFVGISTYAFGVGPGLIAYGSDTTSYEGYCRFNTYRDALFGGANAGGNSGTAQAGGASTITLAVGASSTTDYYVDKIITLTGGTGTNQLGIITAYNGTTKVATVKTAWATAPDATTTYSIPNGGGTVLMPGSYANSHGHSFPGASVLTNGALSPTGVAGGWHSWQSDVETFLGGFGGHVLSMASQRAFSSGMSASFRYKGTVVAGQLVDYCWIDGVATGGAGTETGTWNFYTRSTAGAKTLNFAINNSGVAINGGSTIKRVLQAVAAWDIPSTAAGATSTTTITVTGAAVNDIVMMGLPNTGVHADLSFKAYVSAVDTVTLAVRNNSAGALDPGNLSYRVAVFGF